MFSEAPCPAEELAATPGEGAVRSNLCLLAGLLWRSPSTSRAGQAAEGLEAATGRQTSAQ